MDKKTFIEELKKLGISVDEKQMEKLDLYYKLLIEWNQKINLTRIIDEEDVYLKHFYDSLTLYKAIDLKKDLTICDIGTGAGFPGIVLKIIFPNLKVTLIDSLLKRINFLNNVIEKLGLTNIEAVHVRAEDFIKSNKNKYDLVTSRAVSKLNNLIEYSIPLLKKGGYFIPMKGKSDEEIEESCKKIKKMNIVIEKVYKFELPYEKSTRTLIKIKK